jgi:hypothetical protein
MDEKSLAFRKALGLGLAAVFALVGGAFLLLPRGTLALFNAVSRRLGMVEGPLEPTFFGVLAAAYMFVVTVLAWRMFRSPEESLYPLLLAQAKLASSVLSFLLFALRAPWLIYLVNGIVDGALGLVVLSVYRRIRAADGEAGP